MSNKIQVKRGNLADLPILDAGEVAYTLDEKSVYVGDGETNQRFLNEAQALIQTNLALSGKSDVDHVHVENDITDLDKYTQEQTDILLSGKVDKVTGKGLSANDFTDEEQSKLGGIAEGAEINVNADWDATTGDAEIKNKPTIPDDLADLADDSTHRLVTDDEKSAWNEKQDALTADSDYLTPETASSTYQPKVGDNDNYVTDDEKIVLSNTSGENSGDQDLTVFYTKDEVDALLPSNDLDILVDTITAGAEYIIGKAPTGSATSGALWLIKKVTFSEGNWSRVWADSTATYTKTWDNRLSYTY